MSLENPFFEETVAPQSAPVAVDAFEAALAAEAPTHSDSAPAEVTEDVAVVEEIAATDESNSDSEEVIEEDDENAEFRRALRSAPGDWYVVHSYAGYEKKVKGLSLIHI